MSNNLPILPSESVSRDSDIDAHTGRTGLRLYDEACRAVTEAKSVDEVKEIHDRAKAIHACAKQAHNKQLEADAAEICERAKYKLGEMIAAQRDAGLLNPGTRLLGGGIGAGGFVADPPAHLPTLESLGIDKRLADKARKAFAFSQELFEAALAERRRQILRNTRVEPLLGIAKRMQADKQRQEMQTAALGAMPALITDRYQLVFADMGLTDVVKPESMDHIITDIPYPGVYLPIVEQLGRRAAVWLKPGGSLIVMSGQSFLPEVLAALAKSGLRYRWTLCCETNSGPRTQIYDRHILPKWKPVLWYVKGGFHELEWTGDVIPGGDGNDKRFHDWGQSEVQMGWLVERVSLPGQIILDPFCGGGTTGVAALRLGRQFVGIDIDEKAIATTAERLREVDCDIQHKPVWQLMCVSKPNHLENPCKSLSQ